MFVEKLNYNQQCCLLGFARAVIEADEKILSQESTMLRILRSQMHPNVDEMPVDLAGLAANFPDAASKASLLLELLGIAHADADFHITEHTLITDIAGALAVESVRLQAMSAWTVSLFGLMKESESFFRD